ncbi:hypothetical protein Smic_42920 [Streptomyces microflavus]|uniref:Uncharacterized protein n=1 Tax=Streptomyces microflavus TaxID=1919 RepID=A0A7J0CT93_STRMI|nr:hypothetical protein Smic_42920 [Streptomyces microflavus]
MLHPWGRCAERVHQVAVEGEEPEDVAGTGTAQRLVRQPPAPFPPFVVQAPILGVPFLRLAGQAFGLGPLLGAGGDGSPRAASCQ